MKTAHWSTVTKSIADRYGVGWKEAKRVYDKLRADADRKPSLRMVRALPADLPKPLKRAAKAAPKPAPVAPKPLPPAKPARKPTPAPQRPRRASKPEPPPPPPPPTKAERRKQARADKASRDKREVEKIIAGVGAKPAPARKELQRGVQAEIKGSQRTRNRFERLLAARGLPVTISRQMVGKDITKLWRDSKTQTRIANALEKAYNEIGARGRVSKKTKDRFETLMSKVAKNQGMTLILWHAILKRLYGVSTSVRTGGNPT